jgi:hypothetical protein
MNIAIVLEENKKSEEGLYIVNPFSSNRPQQEIPFAKEKSGFPIFKKLVPYDILNGVNFEVYRYKKAKEVTGILPFKDTNDKNRRHQ